MLLSENRKSRIIIFLLSIVLLLLTGSSSTSEILSGSVNKGHIVSESGVVIDKRTGAPIVGAKVSVPSANAETITNEVGQFSLDIPDKKPVILSVNADGYRPFSLIIHDGLSPSPMRIAVTEQSKSELVIDTRLHHLGDNKFSSRSANAGDFSAPAAGPYFFKEFFVDDLKSQNNILLRIGSIIGIDTKAAQALKQTGVINSTSSPVEVFFNSRKVGEVNINGNNHVFPIPPELLRKNSYNHIRIETGLNQDSAARKDYDDIEFIHLVLEFQ